MTSMASFVDADRPISVRMFIENAARHLSHLKSVIGLLVIINAVAIVASVGQHRFSWLGLVGE